MARSIARHARLASLAAVTGLATLSSFLPACSSEGGGSGNPDARLKGQTSFQSAPPGGNPTGGGRGGGAEMGAADNAAGAPKTGAPTTTAGRKVEETDLYRLDGNRLYYLNAYRGLMVFDVTNVDQPKLLGRSPIYGSPVEMVVRGGIATVVVADWYGAMENGQPFHGSIVRGLDATDPANIKSLGEAKLGGWVRDTRVVGDVLYAVSEDYGWAYGMWDSGYYGGGMGGGGMSTGTADIAPGGGGSGSQGPKVVVSSVSFANKQIVQKGFQEFTGYNAIFNVNSASIMLAHDIPSNAAQPYSSPSGKSELQYVDISDLGGAIALRGKIEVNGSLQGYGTDNGRWNLDFADNHYAHVVACDGPYCGNSGYTLSTVDFANPDQPVKSSELTIPSTGYNVAARFDGSRLYLAPGDGYYSSNNTTPFQIYDLSVPAAPKLAGSTQVQGSVWNFIPAGTKLFALGSESSQNGGSYSGSKIALRYIDVTNAAAPQVLGTSTFGEGWAWTPAAGTFKAFTKDDAQGLVVLPFSGWSNDSYQYNNGVQLIEYTPTSIRTAGAAKTKGWVERGILVKGRVVSLSDMALSVIDYSNKDDPKVISEMTLARNVVSARPDGNTIAQLSSDWWENDATSSELRVLPIQNAEENTDGPSINVKIDGVNARAFKNGDLAYIVSNVRVTVPCPPNGGGGSDPAPGGGKGSGAPQECKAMTPQVQVVDLAGGNAVSRGKITLPVDQSSYSGFGWGWGGCYWYDWYNGEDTIQIQGSALAFRRWSPVYKADGTWEADQKLYIVDLANADSPTLASTLLTTDKNAWWGNMRAVGDKLYTSHYEWITQPSYNQATNTSSQGIVRYYLDQIDLSNRAAPKVGARINVPGLLVGASETDPTLLYTVDYRWNGDQAKDELSVVKVQGNLAYLQSTTAIDGYVGNVFVRGNKAYTSAQRYVEKAQPGYDPNAGPRVQLHEIDLTDPLKPVDRVSSDKKGWGWLLGVEGDRAIITSGWGNEGVDIYKLDSAAPPAFDQFVRTRGWWANSLSRQNDQLFLSSGYWGVQTINLKK